MHFYLARGTELPEVGKSLRGFLQRLQKNGDWEFLTHTSEVKAVFPFGNDIYVVKTNKSIYFYQHFDWDEYCKAARNHEV